MDDTEIGLFGTLRLLKRTTNEQVAAFPIDEETVTFGRDQACSVRLYYPDISALHAKIIFQERKAFLIVLGAIGLIIDGCPVLPSANPSLPTTIPVSNNCEIEIRKKRFVFSYPPKQLRSPLYHVDSPVKSDNGTRRKLRMSMIHSAQVFTPRGKPSSDPLANLRVLQSPVKQLIPSPRKPSALKTSHAPEPDEIEEEIVLVESNNPHVVQEEKDLVILERVDVPAPLPPTPSAQRPRPSVNMYQTPHRRARPSLHRAVLMRSVHRAVMAREEEQEEKEVEEVIVGEESEEQEIEANHDEENHETREVTEEDEPFMRPTRALGSFMTPQVLHTQSAVGVSRGAGRNSFGGTLRVPGVSALASPGPSALAPTGAVDVWGGAKRVRMEPKWRINEIEVEDVKEEDKVGSEVGMKRVSVSEEERRAIQERRKSALITPDPFFAQVPGLRRSSIAPSTGDENARSASPTKPGERSSSPIKPGETSASPTKWGERSVSPSKEPSLSRSASPTKPFASPAKAYPSFGRSVSPMKAPLSPHSEEDEEDTRSLLDRMKRTVEEMKRRRSVGPFGDDELVDESENADADVREVADAERHVGAEGNVEDEQEADHDEENSDKENGRAALLPAPAPPPEPELEMETTVPRPQTPTPPSPTRIELNLDLELERTPFPQLTRRVSPKLLTPALMSTPVPVLVPAAPTTTTVRHRVTRTVGTRTTASKNPSTSTSKIVEEIDDEVREIPPQPAAQKKPGRPRLLRARKAVGAETSDEEPSTESRTRVGSTQPRTRAGSTQPRTRPASTQPMSRPASTEPRNRAASTEPKNRTGATAAAKKAKVDEVNMVHTTRATRPRATPVPDIRSEPAKTRTRLPPKPKAAPMTTRGPSRTKVVRDAGHEEGVNADADDPLDSIGQPEAPTAPVQVQRARRTRAATAPVKEEDVDVTVPVGVAGKGKGATATTRRRAATVVDKENTPSSSKEDESERRKEVEVKRATRATRSRA